VCEREREQKKKKRMLNCYCNCAVSSRYTNQTVKETIFNFEEKKRENKKQTFSNKKGKKGSSMKEQSMIGEM
jgi:hypothetical protein